MESLIYSLKQHLATDFERDLFDAAIVNYYERNNVLRLNNFAYSIRELTRHFLKRLAPDKDVLGAPWFVSNDSDNPEKITRAQRIRYAIQGWISDEFATDNLKLNVKEIIKNLIDNIDALSKYTHIEQNTFNVCASEADEMSFAILESALRFFMEIEEAKVKVFDTVCDSIDGEMLNQFYMETQQPLDIIATHYEVESYIVTSITQVGKDECNINMKASGMLNARLQYGSDYDVKNDDGYVSYQMFPFESSFVVSYKNKEGDVHIEDTKMDINTDSFFFIP